MGAGDSAAAEADRRRARASEFRRLADEDEAAAGRYEIASITERQTAAALAPLSAHGFHVLADRRWPGARDGQVDFVVVGRSGVYLLDTKAWQDLVIDGDRVFRDQADVTEDVMHWADLADQAQRHFAELGLPAGEVWPVIVRAGRIGKPVPVGPLRVVGERDLASFLTARGMHRLTDHQVDRVLTAAVAYFPAIGAPEPAAPESPVVLEPVVPSPRIGEPPTIGAPPDQGLLLTEDEVEQAVAAAALMRPLEDWMTWLHPSQARLVRRSFNGPSRIRGAAGTGKTVVGLHRAAYLARTRPGTVLVTGFVKTLPPVLHSLLERLAPDVAGRIECTGIHAWAGRLLRDRGVRFKVDDRGQVFDDVWRQLPRDSSLVLTATSAYWREEISHVLKGRGLTQIHQYLDLPRTGRRRPLTGDQRRDVWDLFAAYDAELRRRGLVDWEDVILLASEHLRRNPTTAYSAVIVDEAQDLSAAMVRMLHSLVGDAPDGFTLIGDGQQSIYPGGYTLAEAGISLAGRGVVLDINYRNTAEILAFASRVVDGDEFTDIEGEVQKGNRPAAVPRSGPEPRIEHFRSRRARDAGIVARALSLVHEGGSRPGDIGVLCSSNGAADRIAGVLRDARAPVVLLKDYDGAVTDAIKVGTIKRAKGLEFKQVLLPDVRRALLEGASAPDEPSARERWELARRELYVGMTRARDGLWIGVTE